MADPYKRKLNKFNMGGDPNIEYAGENDQDYALPQVVAPVGEAEAKQPVLTDVKTATPTTQDETADLADQYTAAVKQNEKDWQDYVLGVAERNRQQQEEMRQQERADRMAGTATGLTEMAANIANLLTVGQGHATPQQYHSFSQDWMRKADQDMRERRHRTDNMNAQLDRLNYQIEQVKNADRLSDIKLRIDMDKQARKEAAEQAEREWQHGVTERKLDQADRAQDLDEQKTLAGIEAQKASTAQGWARLNETKRQFNAELASKGLNAKGEPDEALMKKITETRAKYSSSGKDPNTDFFFVDKNGDVNVAHMEKSEYEDILSLARGSIADDLGEAQAKEFNQEMSRAIDDKAKNAVLKKWMAKSPTCGAALRLADPTYRGKHGADAESVTEPQPQQSPRDTTPNKKLSAYK